MKKILIDPAFFDLGSTSAGLITGLRKLVDSNLLIETTGQIPDYLQKILLNENIRINNAKENTGNYFFTITIDDKTRQKNKIVVKEATDIDSFDRAVRMILSELRSARVQRKTKETDIKISLAIDGEGKAYIETGIGFFDHMLEQIARHANLNLQLYVKGDLSVDEHHTVEDVGITLGSAILEALGTKKGIKRYGFFLPMDDSIAKCTIDLGGRSYLNFRCKFKRNYVGEFPTELVEEFFRGLSAGLKANIYIKAKGKNEHHKIEAIFKAFAKALNEACRLDERSPGILPSTKGVL